MKYFIAFMSIVFFSIGNLFCADVAALSFFTEPALLPLNAVVAVAQDSRDCLYFGTHSGLVRYDGVEFQKYEHIPFNKSTLCSSQIQTLYMDTGDVLWMGTHGGLERFDIKTETITHYPITNDIVTAIFRDSKQRLWVGSLNGLYLCVDESNKKFITFNNQQRVFFIGNNVIRSISEDSKGTIYAATYDGVWQYDEMKGFFKRCTLLPPGCPGEQGVVYHFIEDAGTYWLSVWGVGLVRIFPELNSYEVYPLQDARIYSLYNNFIFDDYIAAGTWGGGMYLLNKRTKEVTSYKADRNLQGSLTNNVIYTMFIDKYKMLFVGTGDMLNIADINRVFGGIAVPLYKQEVKVRKNLAALYENITYIEADSDYVWSVSNNTIFRYSLQDNDSDEFSLSALGMPEGSIIYTLTLISDERAWVGTNQGLFLFDAATGVFTPVTRYNAFVSDKPSLLVRTIYPDADGTLWIGTYGGGLVHFSPKTGILNQFRRSSMPFSLSNDIVLFVQRDRRGTLWVGTNKGLCKYVPAKNGFHSYLYNVNNPSGVSANRIDSFCEDSAGRLWFGTKDGGICRLDPDTGLFRTYTTADGLSSNQIIGIADVGGEFLWIATAKHLNLFDIQTQTIQIYNIEDIQQYSYFSCSPVSLQDRNLVFFGTNRGILQISQEKLHAFQSYSIPIKIRSMTANGQPINLYTGDTPLSFSYKTNDIEFSFSPPYSSRLKKTVCAYKLIGFDSDWIIASDKNFATYTNLPAGFYTFCVKNIADQDEMIYDSISFNIRPNFLVSPIMIWFYILILSFILFSLYKIHKLYWLQRYAELLEEKQLVLIQDNFTLKELSMLDHLTGIGNRRYIDTLGPKLWQMAREHSAAVSVLMFDIDFFKKYNDSYGHQAGDELLKLIGSDLKKRIRTETDLIGRYGGEEFLIVMYNLFPDKAVHIADGIRKAVATLHERYPGEMEGQVTISIGVFSGIPSDENSFETMIYKADCALYHAKRNGRNQVILYDDADGCCDDECVSNTEQKKNLTIPIVSTHAVDKTM
ncbi:MAG: diguanylate cyclase [Treponema sp.]